MLNISGTMSTGSAADLSSATITLSDLTGTSGQDVSVASIIDNTFTIGKNGQVRVDVTLNGVTKSTNVNLTVTTLRSGTKSSILNVPENTRAMKGQFQIALNSSQQAMLGSNYTVTFYYRVSPTELMHNFMVYNTDGTMMGAKGNGFYILQGKVKKVSGTMGSPDVGLEQESDVWNIYYGGAKVATCAAPPRGSWHKITFQYQGSTVGIFIDDVQRQPTGTGVTSNGYISIGSNKITKIGPIGTQGWRQPTLSSEADLSEGSTVTEMGRGNFDSFTVTSNGQTVLTYACDSIPSNFTSNWQIQYLNAGSPILNTPAFDYLWYQN